MSFTSIKCISNKNMNEILVNEKEHAPNHKNSVKKEKNVEHKKIN